VADNVAYQRQELERAVVSAVLDLLLHRGEGNRAEMSAAEAETLHRRYRDKLEHLLYEVRHKALIDARDAVEAVDV
jgi:hypothetical protein